MSEFRDMIVDAMEYEGVTIYRLAQESGVNYETLKRFLNNTQDLTVSRLEKILKALNFEIGG